jgi:protease I
MSQKILIVTDDAGESFEILYAQHRLREAGFEPVVAASEKKRLNAVIHDFHPGWNTYIEKPGYLIESDVTFNEVRSADFVAMLLIGGRAPEFLRHNAALIALVQDFHREGKWLLSICHGIQILLAAGIGRGLKLTCYENVRFELESCGGTWVNEPCVRDGRIITAQTWQSHAEFYREIVAQLPAGPEPRRTGPAQAGAALAHGT